MASVWHSFLVFLCLFFVLYVPAWQGSPVSSVLQRRSFTERVSVSCSPSGVSLPWHSLSLWAEIPYRDIPSENASGCAASTALWAAHLHLSPQSGTSSHRLPVHLFPPAACRYSISGLELGRCQPTCLTVALALWVFCHPLQRCLGSAVTAMWQVVASPCTASHCRPFLCLEIFGNTRIPCKKEYLHIHVDVHTCFSALSVSGTNISTVWSSAGPWYILHIYFFIFWLMEMQPQSCVKWYSCTFCQEKKKKKQRRERKPSLIRLKSEQDCFW